MNYNDFSNLINKFLPFTESFNNKQGERDNYVHFEVTTILDLTIFKIRLFFGKLIFSTTFSGTLEEYLKLEKDLHSIMFDNGLFVIDDYDRIKPPLMEVFKNILILKRGL